MSGSLRGGAGRGALAAALAGVDPESPQVLVLEAELVLHRRGQPLAQLLARGFGLLALPLDLGQLAAQHGLL